MVKRIKMNLHDSTRYTRQVIGVNLRENDEVVNVKQSDGNGHIFMATNTGYGLWYDESEVSTVGQRALGVISIQLKEGEYVVNGHVFSEKPAPSLVIVTLRGACIRMRLQEIEK